jgi:hypothetical protein
MPYGVTVPCEHYIRQSPICYGSPNDVFAASSGFIRLYTLCFKGKEKREAVVAKATVHKQGIVQQLTFVGRLAFSFGQYKNFTRISPSEFEFLIHLIGGKNLKKGHGVKESHFCSRKFGADATFLGKW